MVVVIGAVMPLLLLLLLLLLAVTQVDAMLSYFPAAVVPVGGGVCCLSICC